jgi:tRNA-2-methylthio-N6-dimethylallyladenosine synthase
MTGGRSKRYLIETWGCQMNQHDTEKMAGILAGLGYVPTADDREADVILLNTCSIREKAESKVYGRLGRLRRLKMANPDLLIGVVGCVAQQVGQGIFGRAPYVDLVMGPRNLSRLGELIEEARREGRSIGLARDDDPIDFPSGTTARASGPKAFVTVMEGCNKSCTYCIVPLTRGREVYRPAAEIMAEVVQLAQEGFREIEFLGQNVNAYHHQESDLASLLRMADRIPGIRRVRFTTSHPGHLKQTIMDSFRDVPTVCNHLHLPAQSGSDRVLKAMNRGYTRSKYMSKLDFLRRSVPGMAFSTDLIVGFPGESPRDFGETLQLMRDIEFDQVYAFAYSPRPGTEAARFEAIVPREAKQERLGELLRLQESIQTRLNRTLVGQVFEVLVDGVGRLDNGLLRGRTRCNRIVHFPGPAQRGALIDVRITRAQPHSLLGEALPSSGAA